MELWTVSNFLYFDVFHDLNKVMNIFFKCTSNLRQQQQKIFLIKEKNFKFQEKC